MSVDQAPIFAPDRHPAVELEQADFDRIQHLYAGLPDLPAGQDYLFSFGSVFLVKEWDPISIEPGARQVTPVAGIPGQTKPNPLAIFSDHLPMKYNNQYYDPSYGVHVPSDNVADYEQAALAAYAFELIAVRWKRHPTTGEPDVLSRETLALFPYELEGPDVQTANNRPRTWVFHATSGTFR